MKRNDTIRFEVAKRTVFGVACALMGALAGTATVTMAFADGDPSTQTVLGNDLVIPYDGYLMRDSEGISGTRDIIFTLYDDADTALWSERITVNLYGGRFSVGLGTQTSLTSTILDAEQLYIGMTVVETDANGTETQVALSGRQAIEPAPFAAWAANSADLDVAGDLEVAQDAVVMGSAGVAGDLDVDGDFILGSATALEENANSELYISSGKGHAGVFVGNDFQVNYSTTLGANTNQTTTINGPDNDGSTAALSIVSPWSQTMHLDGNEIDSNGILYLQANSLEPTEVRGDFEVDGATTLGDAATDTTTVTGVDNDGSTAALMVSAPSNSQVMYIGGNEIDSNADLYLQYNNANAIQLHSDTHVTGALTVSEDITITGDITNLVVSDENRVSQANTTGVNNQSGDLCESFSAHDGPTDACSNSATNAGHYLGAEDNRICFLTGAGFQDLDGNSERAMCSVHVDNGNWYLVASATTSDADVFCNARCLTW